MRGVEASAVSTSIEKSIWKRSPLPHPPAFRSEAITSSEYGAGEAPETSVVKNDPAGK